MVLASNIVSAVISFLTSVEALQGKTIVAAYDSDINPVPLNDGIVSVGINLIEIGETKTITSTSGEITPTTDRNDTVKLKISFFVPYASGCAVAYDLFDKVYTALLFSFSQMKVVKAQCGDVQYNRETQALVCESTITLSGTVSN